MKVNKKTLQSESTKRKLLQAVEDILSNEGFIALKVENISRVSGVDKKLIYFHFGDLKGLFNAFLRSKDFWFSKAYAEIPEKLDKQAVVEVLLNQFAEMKNNKLLTQLLIWELSEKNEVLSALADERDEVGNSLLQKIIEKESFKDDVQPLLALLIGGVYYLSMHATVNGSLFCGLDINKEEDANRVSDTLERILKKIK
ncbi:MULTISPECIES: TetR/AcrR family transcriptional regulator [Sphingobacterium]|uniref:TetR/AcrR family transcriptional regulator n=1 Tax=Sphingobacterium TaxID=28453 RepID=UPI0013D921D6|nr:MULTISPECIES: TetR/AcrR family transcriptional regulator [unclassified Sphingobacterium]